MITLYRSVNHEDGKNAEKVIREAGLPCAIIYNGNCTPPRLETESSVYSFRGFKSIKSYVDTYSSQ